MFVEKAPKGAFCVFTLFQKIDWDGLKRGGGALLEQDMLKIYCGAADESISDGDNTARCFKEASQTAGVSAAETLLQQFRAMKFPFPTYNRSR
ncbi:hypothetical protein [Rahnella bonaserana]|uniref:Uncharacterized protein n=1 Tax=Rahnella bonaserana TaxID=2816248 RepID=A0ABS6LT03_9GAMM|nr:hypothetical protein [Rahnella bonaserana]MBU9854783.1 hypothetical protein [Rahnella bonaserana]